MLAAPKRIDVEANLQLYTPLHFLGTDIAVKSVPRHNRPRDGAYVSMKSTHSNTFSKWQKTNKQNRERVDRIQKGFKEGFRKLQG